MEVDEPYLLKIGFLQCTPRGRTLACSGHEHLGLNLPAGVATQPSFLDDEEA